MLALKLIKWLLSLAVLGSMAVFVLLVPIGGSTLWQRAKAIVAAQKVAVRWERAKAAFLADPDRPIPGLSGLSTKKGSTPTAPKFDVAAQLKSFGLHLPDTAQGPSTKSPPPRNSEEADQQMLNELIQQMKRPSLLGDEKKSP